MLPELTNNVATFIGFGFSGVAHYRCAVPSQALGQGLYLRDDKTLEPLKDIGITNAPVVIYSMPFMDFQIKECHDILNGGGRLIIDVDDYLRGTIGKTDLLGTWTEEMVAQHEEILQQAHLVTCSTQWIADTLTRDLGVETMVCPNGIDLERFNVQKFPRPKDATIIGWSGGVGHLDALKKIAPAINRVMDERPNTIFVSLGSPSPEVFPSSLLDEKFDKRMHDTGFIGLYQHPVAMAQFHIGLAPSMPNDFYRSKSQIRVHEQAAAYVATIAQEPTYKGEIPGQKRLGVDATTDDWVAAILGYVDDPKLRYTDTKKARKYVKDHHSIDVTKKAWQAAIDRALEMQR